MHTRSLGFRAQGHNHYFRVLGSTVPQFCADSENKGLNYSTSIQQGNTGTPGLLQPHDIWATRGYCNIVATD